MTRQSCNSLPGVPIVDPSFDSIGWGQRASRQKDEALAWKFHDTHEIKLKNEIERLARERSKLGEPWVFSSAPP